MTGDPLSRLAEQLDADPSPASAAAFYAAEADLDAEAAYNARLDAAAGLVAYLSDLLANAPGAQDWGDVGRVGLALTHLHRAAEALVGPDPDGEDVAVARLILNGHGA